MILKKARKTGLEPPLEEVRQEKEKVGRRIVESLMAEIPVVEGGGWVAKIYRCRHVTKRM